MVRVSRYQMADLLSDGEALGVMDTDRIIECYNLYARTRPLVVAHRSGVQLAPWPTGERLELAMLDVETNANDWDMATMTGGENTQSRFVIPGGCAGWWLVTAYVETPNHATSTHTGRWRLEICKTPKYSTVGDYEGAQVEMAREDHMTLGATDVECNIGVGTIMYCDEGDEVFARALQTTGTELQVTNFAGATSDSDCLISMVWLARGGTSSSAFTAGAAMTSTSVPDAAAWTAIVDQSTYVTVSRPTVKAGKTSGTSVASGSQVPILLNSEDAWPGADVNGWHSVSSNTNRFTIPASRNGLYLVGASLAAPHGSTSTCRRVIDVRLNGTTNLVREDLRQTFTGNVAGPVMSCGPNLVQLAAGDYIEMTYFQDSGGTLTVVGDDNYPENVQPSNGQLYLHQVQEGTLATTNDFTPNGYKAFNSVLTHTWWNTYLRNGGIRLAKDVRATSIRKTATQAIASGGWSNVTWSSAEFDNHTGLANMFNSGTSTTRMTVATGMDGWWLVGGQLNFSPTGATRRMCAIRLAKNATTVIAKRGVTVESASFCTLCIPATLVYMSAAEYFIMQAYQNTGSNINIGGTTARYEGQMWALWIGNPVDYDPA